MDARTLERRLAKLTSILEVAKALTAERQVERLLRFINDAYADARFNQQADASLLGVFVEANPWRGVPRW